MYKYKTFCTTDLKLQAELQPTVCTVYSLMNAVMKDSSNFSPC